MADKVAKADPALAKQVAHGEVSLPKAVAQIDEKAGKTAKPSIKSAPARAEVETEGDAAPVGVPVPDPRDAHIEELEQLSKELLAENKQLKAQNAQLMERVNGLVGESTAQVRRIKSLMAKLKKAGLE